MQIAPISPPAPRPEPNSRGRPKGFSPLEMMMVVTLILIVASIATPIYQTCATRAREAVLRDHLFTLCALIDRFTLDNGRAPFRQRHSPAGTVRHKHFPGQTLSGD